MIIFEETITKMITKHDKIWGTDNQNDNKHDICWGKDDQNDNKNDNKNENRNDKKTIFLFFSLWLH